MGNQSWTWCQKKFENGSCGVKMRRTRSWTTSVMGNSAFFALHRSLPPGEHGCHGEHGGGANGRDGPCAPPPCPGGGHQDGGDLRRAKDMLEAAGDGECHDGIETIPNSPDTTPDSPPSETPTQELPPREPTAAPPEAENPCPPEQLNPGLCEYELLRQRNILSNEAQLAALGLLLETSRQHSHLPPPIRRAYKRKQYSKKTDRVLRAAVRLPQRLSPGFGPTWRTRDSSHSIEGEEATRGGGRRSTDERFSVNRQYDKYAKFGKNGMDAQSDEASEASDDESLEIDAEKARRVLSAHGLPWHSPEPKETIAPIPSHRTSSGYHGVYRGKRGKWNAQVNHSAIGCFLTPWEAGRAVTIYLRQQASGQLVSARLARTERDSLQRRESSPPTGSVSLPFAAATRWTLTQTALPLGGGVKPGRRPLQWPGRPPPLEHATLGVGMCNSLGCTLPDRHAGLCQVVAASRLRSSARTSETCVYM